MALGSKIKILIIDDEELICWSLKTSFERYNEFAVSCAHTSDDALRNILENQYDVVITDLKLPDANGAELLGKIKGLVQNTPVIVMSAYLSDPVHYDITKYDIFRCVNKPFEISDIICGVQDALAFRMHETGVQGAR